MTLSMVVSCSRKSFWGLRLDLTLLRSLSSRWISLCGEVNATTVLLGSVSRLGGERAGQSLALISIRACDLGRSRPPRPRGGTQGEFLASLGRPLVQLGRR